MKIGTIEGSLSYPSDEIPENMEICAENILTKKQYCTTSHINDKKYTYKLGYKLDVPAGKYYVFAKSKLLFDYVLQDYKAYYSEFVSCGMGENCIFHNPIQITVTTGKTISNINPWDWYNYTKK